MVEHVAAVKRLITAMAAARQLFGPALTPLGYNLFEATVDVLDSHLAKSCQVRQSVYVSVCACLCLCLCLCLYLCLCLCACACDPTWRAYSAYRSGGTTLMIGHSHTRTCARTLLLHSCRCLGHRVFWKLGIRRTRLVLHRQESSPLCLSFTLHCSGSLAMCTCTFLKVFAAK